MRQSPFLLRGLLRQNVTLESMFSLDFPCSGENESLFGTGISLHFRHFSFFKFYNINNLILFVIAGLTRNPPFKVSLPSWDCGSSPQ
jgi:hypothetical protein